MVLTAWFYAEGTEGRTLAPRLLRYALQRTFGLQTLPAMAEMPQGKRYFKDYPEIQFNLSHSGGFALCGVGDQPLGVDIEMVRPRRPGLERRILAPEEQALWRESSDPTRFLIALWTLKESYCKYTGDGLRIPPRESIFSIHASGAVSSNRTGCRFYLVEMPSVCAALCTDGAENVPEPLLQVPLKQL